MHPQKELAKYVSFFEQGVLGQIHVANGALFLMTTVEGEEQVAALFELLPSEVKETVLDRLEKLKTSQFQWCPFRIGAEWSEEELEQIQRGLRFAYSVICGSS